MFNVFNKVKGAVTLFTAPNSPVSASLTKLIRTKYPSSSPHNFKVEITDSVPTPEQWRIISHSNTVPPNIREEVAKYAGSPTENATAAGESEASGNAAGNKVKENKFPILVDWDTGKVAIDNEALAKQILEEKSEK